LAGELFSTEIMHPEYTQPGMVDKEGHKLPGVAFPGSQEVSLKSSL
jgi:hypothetical protein